MKDDVHPDYDFITVRLNDGTTYQTRSTMDREEFSPEVDATNHPFYTGKQRQVSRTGQVERFMKKYGMEEDEADVGSSDESEEDSEPPERAKIDPNTGEVITEEDEEEKEDEAPLAGASGDEEVEEEGAEEAAEED